MSMAAEHYSAPHSLSDALLALLKVAREHGRPVTITRKKAAKLLYLADNQAVADGGEAFSGATWMWQDYGPFDNAWYDAENCLVWDDKIERHDNRKSQMLYGSVRLALVDDIDDPLPPKHMEILRTVVAEHGHKTANALQSLSYDTPPMHEAQAGGQRGVLLNLDRARQAKRFNAVVERFRAMRVDAEPQEASVDAEQLRQQLREEHEDMRQLRLRANAKGLGDA